MLTVETASTINSASETVTTIEGEVLDASRWIQIAHAVLLGLFFQRHGIFGCSQVRGGWWGLCEGLRGAKHQCRRV
jgi:hypothetical protein